MHVGQLAGRAGARFDDVMTSATPGRGPLVFTVGPKDEPWKLGHQWRIWGQKGDFYVKTRCRFVDEFKLSFHGRREGHPGWGFKFDLDGATRQARRDGQAMGEGVNLDPIWFDGERTPDELVRLLRIAVPFDMFTEGAPVPPAHKPIGPVDMAARMPPPPRPGVFACLDLFLATPEEWAASSWRVRAEADNAVLGPITNDTGRYLVGITQMLTEERNPLPEVLRSFDAKPGELASRSVTFAHDPAGFIWLAERPLPAPPGAGRES